MKPTKFIWKNGQLIPWESATTHVLTHALHYGTAVFEGIRAYKTANGPAIFRGLEHYQRLVNSAKIYKIPHNYRPDDLLSATQQLIKENGLDSCYIRPLLYYGYGTMGINPGKNPVDLIIACWEWGAYLGEDGLEKGIRCNVSSWVRPDSRMLPPLAKCVANYANSFLAKQEALELGFDEAILLNVNGTVAEGPGENLFLVKDGKVYSPSPADAALEGITANSAIQIMSALGIPFEYARITRDQLYLADELFFTGTAAELTPIREVNGRSIGEGKRGPVTAKIQQTFFEVVQGKDQRFSRWLALVNPKNR